MNAKARPPIEHYLQIEPTTFVGKNYHGPGNINKPWQALEQALKDGDSDGNS